MCSSCWAFSADCIAHEHGRLYSGYVQVPGFGVEMALKNMEYSALDDSKARVLRLSVVTLPSPGQTPKTC